MIEFNFKKDKALMSAVEVEQIVLDAERRVQKHGSRLTEKRRQVLSCLLSTKRSMSAYELVDYCKSKFDTSIPAMSAYRILAFLEKESLVHKLSSTNKYVACAHISCNHAHAAPQFLICNECQQVKEINISAAAMQDLTANVEQAGFHLVSPQLEMKCLCKNCI